MSFDLLKEEWIPVRDVHGAQRMVSAREIVDEEILSIAAPRPDFSSGMLQWLVGLVQTCYTPRELADWVDLYENPPSATELAAAFTQHAGAFDLLADERRFLQDPEAADGKQLPIPEILVETPTGQTLKRNTDLFVKRRPVGLLCRPCSTMGLFTLQASAPEGGKGHMTSLRGGGPITTAILGENLWRTIWSNVLDEQEMRALKGNRSKREPHHIFPWMGQVRRGGKSGARTTPKNGNPLMVYWATPRRIWFDPAEENGPCMVCGMDGDSRIGSYRTAAFGFQYDGWVHPMSPYRQDRNAMLSLKGGPGGMTYRNWLGWIQEDRDRNRIPALTVRSFRAAKSRKLRAQAIRLWCSGFWTKQNTILHWQESIMPVPLVSPESLKPFEIASKSMIQGADAMRWALEVCAKQALYRRPQDIRGDMGYLSLAYWTGTESSFYHHQARVLAVRDDPETCQEVLEAWHKELVRAGRELFVQYAEGGRFSEVEPERVSKAYVKMIQMFYSKKTRNEFGLAPKRVDPTNISIPRREEVVHATTN